MSERLYHDPDVWATIQQYAVELQGAQDVRKAVAAQALSLKQAGISGPVVEGLDGSVAALDANEDRVVEELTGATAQHHLAPFIKSTKGLGLPSIGRLIALVPDDIPGTNLAGEPRTMGQLRQYCCCGDPARSRRSRANVRYDEFGSPLAPANFKIGPKIFAIADTAIRSTCKECRAMKKALHKELGLPKGVAPPWTPPPADCTCATTGSPYRVLYDAGRARYLDATHSDSCVRCGPKGSPAEPGSKLSLGHQSARALRLVKQAILDDLWLVGNGLPPRFGAPNLEPVQLLPDNQAAGDRLKDIPLDDADELLPEPDLELMA
jgi:hypothetical protein